MSSRRALHFVFKVSNRKETSHFYRDVLGMKVLRHEEFEEGCKAACNGPYDGKWSKTMIGYGPEDDHFVIELTYNYGLGSYRLGNDFRGISIHSSDIIARAKQHGWSIQDGDGGKHVLSPDGHTFWLTDGDPDGDPVKKVSLSSSNLERSIEFWHKKLGMDISSQGTNTVTLSCGQNQAQLELVDIRERVEHGTAFGRIAFSCPSNQLEELERVMKESGETILTPFVSLDTPGKATVQVVILADPDGHEICFVGDEGFRELSQVDSKAASLLDEALTADKSDEWFAKKGKTKGVAQ